MNGDGNPAAGCLGYFGRFEGEEAGNGGSGQIDIEDSDRGSGER